MIKAIPLPFARDAIIPQMSPETFDYHYDKHFLAYVKKTNSLNSASGVPLEEIIRDAHKVNDIPLFQAAGQTWNHAFFWMSISPEIRNLSEGPLENAILRDFGGKTAFCDAFVKAGSGQFGSGWCWLVADRSGTLSLATTHDAMPIWIERDVTPLLVCDVWEHAYYIDWRNDRGSFLQAFIGERANWNFANVQYDAAIGANRGWSYPH